MNKYDKMLGILTLEVGNQKIEITPTKGDARKLIKMQQEAGEDAAEFIDNFVIYVRDLIVREENIADDDPVIDKVETVVELHLMDLMDQILAGFNLAEKGAVSKSGFPKGQPQAPQK